MDFAGFTESAMRLRKRFGEVARENGGRDWMREEVMQGFIVDVGALMKLVMAKRGIREVADTDKKLAHELADCL